MAMPLTPVLLLLLLLGSSVPVIAYPEGAPEDPTLCSTLIPTDVHANHGQSFPSPYSITFSPSSYTAGVSSISVNLTGLCGNSFKGFLIQARRADTTQIQNEILGSFAVTSQSQRVCNNGGMTHTNKNSKTSLSLTWTPPTSSSGHVHFRVTFMQREVAWWGNVKSAVLRDSAVASSSNLESASATIDPSCGATPQTTPQTTLQTTLQTTGINSAGCGTTRGCYPRCSGAACSFLVSWTPEANSIIFEIQAPTVFSGDGYMSIGFSTDGSMGSDFVSDCKYRGGVMSATQSFNQGKSSSNQIASSSVTLLSWSVQNGLFNCRFRQPKQPANSQQPNLNDPFYILFAQGEFNSNGEKSYHRNKYAAGAPTSLASVGTVGAGSGPESIALVKAHGCMMTIAWLFCASVGILIARHFKGLLPGRKVAGTDIWFQLHRTLMVLTFSLCVAAFVIIFIYAKDWSGDTGIAYRDAHPYLGVIVTFFVFVNPIMALFRPHPGTENRYIFNWAHWAVGTTAHILAVVTIYIGTRMGQPNIPDFVIYFVVAFTVVHVVVYICLEIIKWSAGRNVAVAPKLGPRGASRLEEDRSDSYELEQVGANQKKSSSSTNACLEFVKLALFWGHFLVTLAMTIVIVVYIAIA